MTKCKTYRLGELIEKVIDNRGKSPQTSDIHYQPLIEINALGNKEVDYSAVRKYVDKDIYDTWFRSGHPKKGDILFSTVGTIGIASYMSSDLGCIAQNIIALRTNELCESEYLYYYLISEKTRAELLNLDIGGVQPSIKVPHLLNIKLSLPPLSEQKRIAGILSALDDKIDLNRRINANLEAQAMALYKHWFVDFEPWNGVMPHDWREGCIADIVELLNGFAFKSSDFDENGHYRLITIKGVQDGKMSTEGADKLSTIPPQMPEWCLLQKGDILLSLTGNVGRCCLVDENNCLLNQRVAKIRPKNDYNKLFSYIMFRQNEMKARLISIARGTAQMNLSPIGTGKQPILVPPEVVLKDFGGKYNHIIDSILLNIEESSCLTSLRNTLLPKLMNNNI